MRHIDLMEYNEMAVSLHMKEVAVRAALSRAKSDLESLAKSVKGEVLNGEIEW